MNDDESGPRDPEQGEGERGAPTPEVSTGRQKARAAGHRMQVVLLIYYMTTIGAVLWIGGGHLRPLEIAPERATAQEQPTVSGGDAVGGGDAGSSDRDGGLVVGPASSGTASGPAAGHEPRASQDPGARRTATPVTPSASLLDVLILVALAGAMGGALSGLASLEAFVGSGTYSATWVLYYWARPFAGAGMAMTVSLVLGARLLGVSVDYATHPWVFVGWAIMSGLFSAQALRKLRELFDVMFQAKRPETSSTQLAVRAPLVEAIAPITVTKPAPAKPTPPSG